MDKATFGFHVYYKIWQILKHFARVISLGITPLISEECTANFRATTCTCTHTCAIFHIFKALCAATQSSLVYIERIRVDNEILYLFSMYANVQ